MAKKLTKDGDKLYELRQLLKIQTSIIRRAIFVSTNEEHFEKEHTRLCKLRDALNSKIDDLCDQRYNADEICDKAEKRIAELEKAISDQVHGAEIAKLMELARAINKLEKDTNDRAS